jgi:hypothetical protein
MDDALVVDTLPLQMPILTMETTALNSPEDSAQVILNKKFILDLIP